MVEEIEKGFRMDALSGNSESKTFKNKSGLNIQPDLFLDQDMDGDCLIEDSQNDNLLIVNAPGVLARKLEFLEIKTYGELRRRRNELRTLSGFGSQCEIALQKMLSNTEEYSIVDTGDLIVNPPSILAKKLESLGIHTYTDLKLRISELRSIDGYGNKSEIALLQWIPDLELDDSDTAIESFSIIRECVNELFLSAERSHGLFLFSVPGLLLEKFNLCGVDSIVSLRDKFDELTTLPTWKRRSVRILYEFVKANLNGYLLDNASSDRVLDFFGEIDEQISGFCEECDETELDIVKGRIGFDTSTFQKLAERHNISKQRVRQIEQKKIGIDLSHFLMGFSELCEGNALSCTQKLIVSLKKDCFVNLVLDRMYVLKNYGDIFGDNLDSEKWRKLCEILKIVGLSLTEVKFCGDVEFVLLAPQVHSSKFLRLFHSSCEILREEITPIGVNILIDKINPYGIDDATTVLQKFFSGSQFFEFYDSGLCLKLKYLSSRKAQATRVLWDRGDKMHFQEIGLEIRKRLGEVKDLSDEKRHVAGMFHSEKMYTIGKTGFWALNEWELDDRNLADRMVAAFKDSNQAMTIEQLIESEHLTHMKYPRSSIQAYLSMGYNGLFDGIGNGQYILSDWRGTLGISGEKKRHYNKVDWHKKLKDVLSNKYLTTREISEQFKMNYGIDDGLAVINQRLNASPNISFKNENDRKLWFWSNDDVLSERLTIRERVLNDLKALILDGKDDQVLLTFAREQLTELHAIPNVTFYAAVSSCENIRKSKDATGRIVLSWIPDAVFLDSENC